MENKDTQSTPSVQQPLEYKNENVRLTVHLRPRCEVEFEVQTTPEFDKKARAEAVKVVKKSVVIDGFRKGKAPDAFVLEKFPAEVDKQALELVAKDAFDECYPLANIPLLNNEKRIRFKPHSHSSVDGTKLTLYFDTEPTPPKINAPDIVLNPAKRQEIDDAKVDEVIRQAQFFYAKWQEVEDRPVQEGDYVKLDVFTIDEDPPKQVFNDLRCEVSDRSMAQWLKALIIGRNKNETLIGVSTPDKDAPQQEIEGLKDKKVQVFIRQIESATLPALDDAFAKTMKADSVDALKTNIRNLLNKQSDDHVADAENEQINERLLELYPFDLPSILIEKETDYRMRHLIQDPDFQSNWVAMTQEARKKTVESVAAQSEKALRLFYLCRSILAQENIQITPADVVGQQNKNPLDMITNRHTDETSSVPGELQKAEAYSRALLNKATQHIRKNATIAQI